MGFWDFIWDPISSPWNVSRGKSPTSPPKINSLDIVRPQPAGMFIPEEQERGRFTSNGLLDRLRGFSQSRGPTQQPSITTTEDILARLEALQNPNRYMMDSYELEQQARAAAAQQYDPLIAQLANQMKVAEGRALKNRGQLGDMFGSLSRSLEGDLPKITQGYENTKRAAQSEYDELQQSIQGQYQQTQQDQEEMLKRLNIEAAAPDILSDQQRDRDYFEHLAKKEAQTLQSSIGLQQSGSEDFTRQGAQIARLEGTQRQANLMDQLRELLGSYDTQIGAHKAAKEQAYLSGLTSLQRENQQFGLAQSQRDFDNYIKSIQLGRDLKKDSMASIDAVKSPSDVARFALGSGLPPASAQRIQGVFNTAIGTDPSILAGVDPAFGTALSKEALAARIVEQGRNAGLNRQEQNILQDIALQYFGRR